MQFLWPTLIQNLLQQNRSGTGEDKAFGREEDVRRYLGGIPSLNYLCLAMWTDILAMIRGNILAMISEFVTVRCDLAVTFAFPDTKVEANSRSVLLSTLISSVGGSTLN